MKLILRGNDSAISVLMFIYNNFISLTNKDTIKLSSILKIMKVFEKNETAVRMSLSRALKAEILVNARNGSEVSYTLTSKGREAIHIWNTEVKDFLARYQMRNKNWNGKWYLLNINFSKDKKEFKQVIFDKLRHKGFAFISTGLWISPYNMQDEVEKLIKKYGIENTVMQVYGEIEIYKDRNVFLNEVYSTDKLNDFYNNFVETYKNKLSELKTTFPMNECADYGKALPLLHEMGWNFFNIASEDPVLPKELFPIWKGEEATDIMKEYREILLEPINQYLEKFI